MTGDHLHSLATVYGNLAVLVRYQSKLLAKDKEVALACCLAELAGRLTAATEELRAKAERLSGRVVLESYQGGEPSEPYADSADLLARAIPQEFRTPELAALLNLRPSKKGKRNGGQRKAKGGAR